MVQTPRPFTRAISQLAIAVFAIGNVITLDAAQRNETQALPEAVRSTLSRHRIAQRQVSLFVQEIGAPAPRLAHYADDPRSPASTIKLLTTMAALEELGPAFRWKTVFYAAAPIKAGRLEGDLYIKGHGDPALVIEQFWRMLYELRGTGLQEITGDLVIDNSYFAAEPGDPGEFDGQPLRAYNVLPRALLVNFQAVRLRFIPLADSLRIVAEPMPADLAIENRVKL
jgi:serine-type D-Ala-D-Ala carboxypeptidase/endopeptidase (penicillin-binding protein 4)